MTSPSGRDWRLVLLTIGTGGAGLISLALAAMTAIYALIGRLVGLQDPATAEPWAALIVAGDLSLIAAVSLVAAYHSVLALRRETPQYSRPRSLRPWFTIVLLITWLVISVVASALVDREAWQAALPPLHMLAIGIPVYLLARIAINGLRGGSPLRLWGAVATGMLVGTGIAIVIEVSLLILGASAGILFVALDPEHLRALETLATQLGQAPSTEHVVAVLGPILTSPITAILTLLAVSGVVPVVEELAKSTTTWVIFGRLSTSADGFWSGALSGAGFALLEGLMSSADPTAPWVFILLLRGGSSLMHIVASALAGWGIASFRTGRRWRWLIAGYVAAMALHAAWNASIVGIGYGAIKAAVDNNRLDPVGLASASAGGLVLVSLIAILPIALIILNHKLRAGEVVGATPGTTQAPDLGDSSPTEG